MGWVRPLAWAASLVLAAGIGYASRSQSEAALASRIEPTSIGRIDTVYLDIPAQTNQPTADESDHLTRDALNRTQKVLAATPPAEPPRSALTAPARQNAAGARAEEEQSGKRRAGLDTSARVEGVIATQAAEKKAEAPKDADAKLQQSFRERAANDLKDQTKQAQNRPQPASPSVAGATAESRLMAKTSADESPTIISFPRAIDLLGGRMKLIEGMVPARVEAVGRTVRVIYLIDEGNLVLAQVAATDSLNWSLSGPLTADSLARLRLRVR